MMSILPEEENNPVKMKQTLMSDRSVKEDTRPFLGFSRENLSISHSDLEQGFNRSRLKPNKNTILSVTAFVIALLCLCLEIWKLHYLPINSHEMEQLKRDVDSLKHRFLEQNLINELKAFQEQLYAGDSNENHDPGETDINSADYDSSYDDDVATSHDYSEDYHTPLIYGNIPSDLPEITTTSASISTSPNPGLFKAKRGQEFGKTVRENHKSIEREHLKEEISDNNSTKRKRDVLARSVGLLKKEESTKLKRSVDDTTNDTAHLTSNNHHSGNRQNRKTIVSRTRSYDDSKTDGNTAINSTQAIVSSERHPPKKYYGAHFEAYSSTHDGQSHDEIGQPNRRTSEEAEYVDGETINWWNDRRDIIGNRNETHRPVQNLEVVSREFHRGLNRRHLRASRQVYAIHYGADSTLFSAEDEHTGNGRARHSSNIFRAWRPSDWVADLGMNRHFTLATDGKLTVHESGLYLVYAQIHYLDEHDENGFHLLANGRSIMQCMVYSPGIGHKSRSCFSAQVAVFHAGDNLILKDVGSARYTLFQHDKSFFGLVKLGELRQQRHQSQHGTSSHP